MPASFNLLTCLIDQTYGLGYNYPYPPQPWKEADARSRYKEILESMFYYPQVDAVKRHSKGSSWGWSETIPDGMPPITSP